MCQTTDYVLTFSRCATHFCGCVDLHHHVSHFRIWGVCYSSYILILDNTEKPDGPLQKDDRLFFRYLGLVEKPKSPESHVDDFAAFILRILNYDSDDQDRVICQRPELSFPMAGQRVEAKSDLCVRDENDYLLLVQEDKVSF